ncbi:MAG: TlpA disulfide reductase family protein [Chitinophagaceae bacterium]
MRYILCIILILSTASIRASDILLYQIEGKILNKTQSGFAYLYIPATGLQSYSLVNVSINNNRFSFSGSLKQQRGKYTVARLFISPKAGINYPEYSRLLQIRELVYKELIIEEKVSVTFGPDKDVFTVVGGSLNDDHTWLREIAGEAVNRYDSLRKMFNAALLKSKIEPAQTRAVRYSYGVLFAEQQNRQTSELLSFISSNPASLLALEKLNSIAVQKEASWRRFMRDLEHILSVVPQNWLQSPKGKLLVQKVKTWQASQRLVAGVTLPNYIFRDGKDSVAVRDFRGKYLLLHFWTSWSENSMEAQSNLLNAFYNYNNKGFSILQVSLDANYENWKRALPEQGVAWKQARCTSGWDAKVERTFEVYGVPTNYLIDQKGKIISSNLTGEELEMKLEKILN